MNKKYSEKMYFNLNHRIGNDKHPSQLQLIATLLLTTVFATSSFGQLRQNSTTITSGRVANETPVLLASATANDARLLSLIKELQPSIYVTSGDVKVFGDAPVCAFVDASAVAQLSSTLLQNQRENIEILTITIGSASNLSTGINLSVLNNFPKLKYIHIRTSSEADNNAISRKIKNPNSQFLILFSIITAS